MTVLISRQQIRQRVVEALGGIVGTITSGTTSTITIDALANAFGSNAALQGRLLFLPDDASADQQRLIQSWSDSTGVITLNTSLAGAPTAADPYEIMQLGDPPKLQLDRAINRALGNSRRSVRTMMPTVSGRHRYPLSDLPWVRTRHDVLDVKVRPSMNLVPNEDFTLWGDGTGPQLAQWDFTGTGGLVTRVASDDQYSGWTARLTRSGDGVSLTRQIGLLDRQLIGKTIQFTASGVCDAATANITISDGATSTAVAHSGDGEHEWLSGEHVVSADATQLAVSLNRTDDGNADFSRVIVHEGSSLNETLRDYGSQQYTEYDWPAEIVNSGDGADVFFAGSPQRGQQVVVTSLQNYAPLAAEADVTDIPMQHIVAATIVELTKEYAKGEDRERWDALRAEYLPIKQMHETATRRGGQAIPAQLVVSGV